VWHGAGGGDNGVLDNGIVLLLIASYSQQVTPGTAIIITEALDTSRKLRRQRTG
jgi:ribose/xylose/arabinose/galactoside ABC-type transport system permease subunit